MSKNKILQPKIRFKEFSGENAEAWEQRKLGKMAEFYSGLTYSPDNIIPKGGTFVLRSSNVKDGELVDADNVYIDSSFVNSSNVQVGDIVVVVRNGSRDLIGKHAQVKIYMENTVIGAFMTGIRAKEPNYINALLDTQQFKIEINKNLGATINQITTGAFKEMQFSITPNIEEQHKIGSLFDKLDNCITLHQRKLEALEHLKKTLLSKMFPKNGKAVPELRFAGFTDNWEQRRLGEISNSYSGGTPSVGKKEYYGGDIPFIRSAEINSENTELTISEAGLNNSSAKIVEVGDILYAMYGATSGEVGISRINGAINQAILAIRPKEYYDSQFIMQWLRDEKQKILDKYLQGGQGNLSGSIVKDLKILFPNYDEQRKIGAFFERFDHLITLHQRKIEQYQELKKTLLSKMFI